MLITSAGDGGERLTLRSGHSTPPRRNPGTQRVGEGWVDNRTDMDDLEQENTRTPERTTGSLFAIPTTPLERDNNSRKFEYQHRTKKCGPE